jgi:hypothetical protein
VIPSSGRIAHVSVPTRLGALRETDTVQVLETFVFFFVILYDRQSLEI